MTVALSPPSLDAAQRSTLERLIIRARVLLQNDLAAQAEGRFGIYQDGTIEEEAALPDDTTDKVTRRDLEQILAHLRTLGEDPAGAVARLLREAAFTHLNRLVAIRIAEVIGLLPESVATGPESRGFRDFGEIMPMLAGDYRAYLRLCGDELAADAPALFDPRNPLLALEPSTAAFDELVALVADPGTTEIWPAPDTLGWAYQFFNTAEERHEMREESAPRNSRELAVRNQFFTPRYVVDFLVQNTIGRRIIENDPDSALLHELPLLVDPPTERGPSLDLEEVKCLDPACGSGHFLLGCYDVLERAWELTGMPPSESAPKIVSSLWGVDIDARCAQVASAAIVLRARRHCRDLVLPRPNIVTARGLPGGSAVLPPDLQLSAGQRSLIDRVSEALAHAPLLGVLLKAEEALDQEIRHGTFGGRIGTLELTDEAAEAAERELLSHLQAIADQASSSVVERLLAAEADDALRLIEIVRQRYDAVLMNPPFGEPVPETKPYLRAAYPWIPTRDYNLLAAFVGRGLELCNPTGYLGAITSRVGLFLKTFEDWRLQVLLGHHLVTLADLGYGVMEQALVEAAAYVVGSRAANAGDHATFVRLLRDTDRSRALFDAVAASRALRADPRLSTVDLAEFHAVPGSPVAYWVAPSVRRLFRDLPSLEDGETSTRVGLQTGDDFRFVRLFWEVDSSRIGRSSADTLNGRSWVPFSKGGEYSPYWSDLHLVVSFVNDGADLSAFPGSVLRSPQYYFRSGVTWPRRTASGFGVRLLPQGALFSDQAPSTFSATQEDTYAVLAWMTSRLVRVLLDGLVAAGDETTSGGAARAYQVGRVQILPGAHRLLPLESRQHSALLAELHATADAHDETARSFVAPFTLLQPGSSTSLRQSSLEKTAVRTARSVEMLALHARLEEEIHAAVGLDADALRYVDEEAGRHPALYKVGDVEEAQFSALWTAPIDELVDTVVKLRGGSRAITNLTFVADRRLEVIAHALERSPRQLAEMREKLALLPPEEPISSADDVFSYFVGAAFGRWDVRIGRDPSRALLRPELLAPVPVCPPGLLVDSSGMPAREFQTGYPLEIPPARLFVDEPGHSWDIETAVLRTAAFCFADSAAIVAELLEILGRKTVREHLRKQFFKDHLSRYSKSRRKAPIYWPLTVPSKSWGVWVYAPTFTRETLYAVAGEAGRRERLAGEAIARLQGEQYEGREGPAARKLAEELDAEEKLAEELRLYRAEAERVAGLGWEPDLDDGILLCAAPLADLFPSWPDVKKARDEIRKGQYEWATVAKWAKQL